MPHDAPRKPCPEVIDGPDGAVIWTTVGLDVGSSTTQAVFSRSTLARRDAGSVVTHRRVLRDSEVILTPYAAPEIIDAAALAEFLARQYAAAGLTPDHIDAGAVILTGLAASADNARAILDAVADGPGRFVAVAAGDVLEARLAASGAGAREASRGVEGALIHIDIGGRTTKLSAWRSGRLLGVAAIDTGARLITFHPDGRVEQVTPALERMAAGAGVTIAVGEPLDPAGERRLTGAMARDALRYAGVLPGPPRGPNLLRTNPLFEGPFPPVAAVIVSGGVSEYIYGRETATFGDLGRPLGEAIRAEIDKAGVALIPFERGVRGAVLGVSTHSAQLSGAAVFVSDAARLPQHDVPVIAPQLEILRDGEDVAALGAGLAEALKAREARADDRRLAVAIEWDGWATDGRLTAVAEALVQTIGPALGPDDPLIVVIDSDLAGRLGERLAKVAGPERGVICLDGIDVQAFDHIDIGEFAPGAGALPVVVKSLLFAGSGRPHEH